MRLSSSRAWGTLGLLLLAAEASRASPSRPAEGASCGVAHGDGGAPAVSVVAGPHYRASWSKRLLLGDDYRELWTTPLRVPLLDPEHFEGGLEVEGEGGGKQTESLHLRAKSGHLYKFRSVDKDPSKILPHALRGTLASGVVRDQVSAGLPAAVLAVAPLQQAAGILTAPVRLFVMGDSPRLGRFRREFARLLGTLEEEPEPGVTAGFESISEVRSTEKLDKHLASHPGERVDQRAFLRARLFDLLVGDWDRHVKQWHWGRSRESGLWLPIPQDRDQAFSRFQGLALGLTRRWAPRLAVFDEQYSSMAGMTTNSRDLDRRLLDELDWSVWRETVTDLQRRLDDRTIAAAVCRLPPEYEGLVGHRLAATLRVRRDRLERAAAEFYALLARQADVFGTTGDDDVRVERRGDGSVRVRLSLQQQGDPPYFDRTFVPSETREIRIELLDGTDRVTVLGQGPRRIAVRAVGGGGFDTLDDAAGGVRFYDAGHYRVVEQGPGTHVDTRPWNPPRDADGDRPLDSGHSLVPVPWLYYYREVGVLVGGGLQLTRYGFRQYPYAERHRLRLGFTTGADSWRLEYLGDFRRSGAFEPSGEVRALASGFEVLPFYGYGNESPAPGRNDEFYDVPQQHFALEPALVLPVGPVSVRLGPTLRFSRTRLEPDRRVTAERPYGIGDFGQLGGAASVELDRRDRPTAARRGVFVTLAAEGYPAVWSVRSGFGSVRGSLAGYLPLSGRLTLALRVGGQKVLGDAPFHDAAFIGGWQTVRGLPSNRYAGDGSLFGNGELRVRITRVHLVYQGDLGVFALADAGRVFVSGESSSRWHAGVGAGAWLGFEDGTRTLCVALARGDGGHVSLYLYGGLLF